MFTSRVIERGDGETTYECDTSYRISLRVSLRLFFPSLYQDRFSLGSALRFYEGSHLE